MSIEMIIAWLISLRVRFGLGVGRWHHWLPALAYIVVMLSMTAAGGGLGRAPSLTAAFVSATSGAAPAGVAPSFGRPYPQGVGAEQDLHQDQGRNLLPLTVREGVLVLPMQEYEPLLVGSAASRMPTTMDTFEKGDRKKVFINLLLPTIMVALDEVRQERRQLLGIIAEIGESPVGLVFSEEQTDWQQRLGKDKSKFILGLTRKYRSAKADELLLMVDVLPPSLVIAQGALESSWGGSRIATEVNNLFGMFTSADAAMATGQDGGNTPKIMEYDSILESVRAYVLNINRLSAYKELRRIRSETLDPMLIADGLLEYSERKELYIDAVKHIIACNKLQDYDTLILAAG